MTKKTLDPYSPSLPRPVSGVIEEHHVSQLFRQFKMTPVALAIMVLPIVLRREGGV